MGYSPSYKAISPRIGAAYQLNPKTVIRAGYGRSFDLGVFGSIFGHIVDAEPADSDEPVDCSAGWSQYFRNQSEWVTPHSC